MLNQSPIWCHFIQISFIHTVSGLHNEHPPFQVRHLKIQNLQPFVQSEMFTANNFTYDSRRKLITQRV